MSYHVPWIRKTAEEMGESVPQCVEPKIVSSNDYAEKEHGFDYSENAMPTKRIERKKIDLMNAIKNNFFD